MGINGSIGANALDVDWYRGHVDRSSSPQPVLHGMDRPGQCRLRTDTRRMTAASSMTAAFRYVCLPGTGEVYIYVRPELSEIRHSLDQNYQLSFSP